MATKDNNTCKVTLNDEVLIDLTDSTVTPTEVAKGFVCYSANGAKITGTLQTNIFKFDIVPESDYINLTSVWEKLESYINDKANNITLRNGDFLIITEYYNSDKTGNTSLLTYVYDASINDIDTFANNWLPIGSSVLTDNKTISLTNGQVSLANQPDNIDNTVEYLPYLNSNKELQWQPWSDFTDNVIKIDNFFKETSDTADIIDSMKEIDVVLKDLQQQDDNMSNKIVDLQEVDTEIINRINNIDEQIIDLQSTTRTSINDITTLKNKFDIHDDIINEIDQSINAQQTAINTNTQNIATIVNQLNEEAIYCQGNGAIVQISLEAERYYEINLMHNDFQNLSALFYASAPNETPNITGKIAKDNVGLSFSEAQFICSANPEKGILIKYKTDNSLPWQYANYPVFPGSIFIPVKGTIISSKKIRN